MTEQATTREEAREGLRAALQTWVDEGIFNPVIPAYSDFDGDGTPDYWGLDTFGRLIEVPSTELEKYTNVTDIDAPTDPAEMQGP